MLEVSNVVVSEPDIRSSKEQKKPRKIKFAQKSYVAFVNAVKKATKRKMEKLEKQYSEQLGKIEYAVGYSKSKEVAIPENLLNNNISYLTSIGVKLIDVELRSRRLEQILSPKPVKINKEFVKNIKKKISSWRTIISKNKGTRSNIVEQYRNVGAEFNSQIKNNASMESIYFDGMRDPRSYIEPSRQRNVEPTPPSNASSLFANWNSPVAEPSAAAEVVEQPDYVTPGYSQSNAFSGGSDLNSVPVEVEDEELVGVAENNQGNYSNNQIIPPASFGSHLPIDEIFAAPENFEIPDLTFRYDEENRDSGLRGTEIERIGRGVFAAEPIRPAEIETSKSLNFEDEDYLSGLSENQILDLQSKLDKIRAKKVAEENHDRVQQFHSSLQFDDRAAFSRSSLAEVERLEQERREAKEAEFAQRRIKMENEVIESLINGELSPLQIKSNIAVGLITADNITLRKSDPNLTYEQAMYLGMAEAVITKMEMDRVNSADRRHRI